ncbi:MAG: GTP-dependent dephospho-CoA kinase family protein [Candidatus Syntropharchaeia archaeon]
MILPEELREELKKPIGKLYSGRGIEPIERMVEEMGNPEKIISIGDMVTFYLLEYGIVPDLSIVDGKTKRGKTDVPTEHKDFKNVRVKNPAASITKELVDAIKNALEEDKPTRIFIDGEEDLAVLPVVENAPISSLVVYGQPDEGVVAVEVTEELKIRVRKFMERMERE